MQGTFHAWIFKQVTTQLFYGLVWMIFKVLASLGIMSETLNMAGAPHCFGWIPLFLDLILNASLSSDISTLSSPLYNSHKLLISFT